MTRYYTGVGHRARNVSPEGREFILWLSAEMARRDIDLVSGDADGTDEYFEANCLDKCLIYLPKPGFGINPTGPNRVLLTDDEKLYAERQLYYYDILPEIKGMSPHNKCYHLRNFYQSYNLGNIPEVCFYYAKESPDGVIEGGTRTAVYTARHFGTPCYNLYTKEGRDLVYKLLLAGEWD